MKKLLALAPLAFILCCQSTVTLARGTRVANAQWRVTFNEINLRGNGEPGDWREGNIRSYTPKPGYRFVFTFTEAKNVGKAPAVFDFGEVQLVAGGEAYKPSLIMSSIQGLTDSTAEEIAPGGFEVKQLIYSIKVDAVPQALQHPRLGKADITISSHARRAMDAWPKNKPTRTETVGPNTKPEQ